ncbi:MAG: hypothetical protein WC901_06625 [Candidatus Margulisiibacteriota bacterium]
MRLVRLDRIIPLGKIKIPTRKIGYPQTIMFSRFLGIQRSLTWDLFGKRARLKRLVSELIVSSPDLMREYHEAGRVVVEGITLHEEEIWRGEKAGPWTSDPDLQKDRFYTIPARKAVSIDGVRIAGREYKFAEADRIRLFVEDFEIREDDTGFVGPHGQPTDTD